MKKHIIILFLIVFCTITAVAETNISVTQSIRYGNGTYAPLDTPQFSISKALKEGGKIQLRYDFEITNKSFFDPDDIYIFLKLPGGYRIIREEDVLKVTALHGAEDIALKITELSKHLDYYSELKEMVGRNPKIKNWGIFQEIKEKSSTQTTVLEEFTGIALKMTNKKGNKAHIEFYFNCEKIIEYYNYFKSSNPEFANWINNNLYEEIPIDINFHSEFSNNVYYSVPKKEYKEYLDENYFFITVGNKSLSNWNYSCSKSNSSFTLMGTE